MNRFTLNAFLVIMLLGLTTSCFNDDRDDNVILASEINDFVWKGMNAIYLYKDNISDLANNRFSSDQEYANYLNSFSTPEDLFESVIYQRETVDKYSWIVDDYIALEQLFSGVVTSNGMEFGLRYVPGSSTDVFGYVRYILPNTDAESKGLQRGDVFYAIDGNQLTRDNWRTLLSSENYTINLGDYNNNGTPETDDDVITPSTESVSLTKSPYTKNPIFKTEIFDVGGENVGYLMYNGFTGTNTFDSALNSVFGNFASSGITDLVLDLRYNPGGSVSTATWLASMITGQFTGDVFIKEQWNSEWQEYFENNDPNRLLNPFVSEMIKLNTNGEIIFQENINHLNLNRIYVLTTGSSASASELIINGLNPHIDNLIQIGTTTTGKYQASTTLYDSDNFGKEGVNPNHTYALQPLIFKSLNAIGNTDYDDGLTPDILLAEDIGNLGVLGNINEPLLAAALADILGTGRISYPIIESVKLVGDSNDFVPFAKEMYIDKKLPKEVIERLQLNQ